MPNFRGKFVPGGTYFFTVTLLERKRDLLVSEIGLFLGVVLMVSGCQANPQYQGAGYQPLPTGYNAARSNPSRYYPAQQAVPETAQSPGEQLKIGERYADENSKKRNDVKAVR